MICKTLYLIRERTFKIKFQLQIKDKFKHKNCRRIGREWFLAPFQAKADASEESLLGPSCTRFISKLSQVTWSLPTQAEDLRSDPQNPRKAGLSWVVCDHSVPVERWEAVTGDSQEAHSPPVLEHPAVANNVEGQQRYLS